MALVEAGGRDGNVASDTALGSGSTIVPTLSSVQSPLKVTVMSAFLNHAASANGFQSGHIAIRNGTTELWRGAVFASASSGNVVAGDWYPNFTFTPSAIGAFNALYSAVQGGTTAACSVVWKQSM